MLKQITFCIRCKSGELIFICLIFIFIYFSYLVNIFLLESILLSDKQIFMRELITIAFEPII